MNCISCQQRGDPYNTNNWYCKSCDIHLQYPVSGWRIIGDYEIGWETYDMFHTTYISKEIWSDSPESTNHQLETLHVFDEWKLFDIKTVEQLEKLLVLL